MYDLISQKLIANHAHFTIHEHIEVRTVADSLEKLPFPLERYLTTVAFRIKHGDWVLTGRRGMDRIDYKKLAAALGVRREALSLPASDEVLATLGLEAGTVCPIPTVEGVQVIFDQRLSHDHTLYAGVGRAGRTLEITLDELLRITGGRIVDIVQPNA
jgi:Cys-tRNA(Pro)/Cys-tRNA(Cys) deacylase